jgi:hypothetical protein
MVNVVPEPEGMTEGSLCSRGSCRMSVPLVRGLFNSSPAAVADPVIDNTKAEPEVTPSFFDFISAFNIQYSYPTIATYCGEE